MGGVENAAGEPTGGAESDPGRASHGQPTALLWHGCANRATRNPARPSLRPAADDRDLGAWPGGAVFSWRCGAGSAARGQAPGSGRALRDVLAGPAG